MIRHPLIRALKRLGGWYECPKDQHGKRLGPLVGYTGRDEQGRQKVGEIYTDFSVFEERPVELDPFAQKLSLQVDAAEIAGKIDVFCGMPEGGRFLAGLQALFTGNKDTRHIYPEKKVTHVGTETSPEISHLVWGRHKPEPGEQVALVEDAFNNFSTTEQAIRLVTTRGARVVALVGLFNRSTDIRRFYFYEDPAIGQIPIICILEYAIPQYLQDDPRVREDVERGNVVWKPKFEKERLRAAMRAANT